MKYKKSSYSFFTVFAHLYALLDVSVYIQQLEYVYSVGYTNFLVTTGSSYFGNFAMTSFGFNFL